MKPSSTFSAVSYVAILAQILLALTAFPKSSLAAKKRTTRAKSGPCQVKILSKKWKRKLQRATVGVGSIAGFSFVTYLALLNRRANLERRDEILSRLLTSYASAGDLEADLDSLARGLRNTCHSLGVDDAKLISFLKNQDPDTQRVLDQMAKELGVPLKSLGGALSLSDYLYSGNHRLHNQENEDKIEKLLKTALLARFSRHLTRRSERFPKSATVGDLLSLTL